MGRKNGKKQPSVERERDLGFGWLMSQIEGDLRNIQAFIKASLTPDESLIMGLLHLDSMTFTRAEAAKKMGKSVAELRTIEASAMAKLQAHFPLYD